MAVFAAALHRCLECADVGSKPALVMFWLFIPCVSRTGLSRIVGEGSFMKTLCGTPQVCLVYSIPYPLSNSAHVADPLCAPGFPLHRCACLLLTPRPAMAVPLSGCSSQPFPIPSSRQPRSPSRRNLLSQSNAAALISLCVSVRKQYLAPEVLLQQKADGSHGGYDKVRCDCDPYPLCRFVP